MSSSLGWPSSNDSRHGRRYKNWRESKPRLPKSFVLRSNRNSLTPIKLTIQNLLAAYEEDPDGFEEQFKAGGELILGQIEALHRIAGQFSTYARLPVRNPQPIDLGKLVDEVASLYAAAGEMMVERRGEKDPGKLVVLGDRDELLRALGNLVTNARQAKATRVSISIDLQDSYVRMVVNDNGAGIAPDILERIFEPSFTTKTSGTGLGMPIVKRIVDDHAGTIALRSTPGLGTRVTILLPAVLHDVRHNSGAT